MRQERDTFQPIVEVESILEAEIETCGGYFWVIFLLIL